MTTAVESPQQIPVPEEILTARDTRLQELLGTDYEFARDTGLIDMFYVDPVTGEDGLLHTLEGLMIEGPDGAKIPVGYHHEPSAPHDRTYVDREHNENADSQHKADYRENRYEPYQSITVIDGYKKASKSTMYPKEYDALTVIQAIRQARDNRDVSEDVRLENGLIQAHGKAPLVDGKSTMDIRLILAPEGDRVVTAFPFRIKKNVLHLGRRAMGVKGERPTKEQALIDEHLGIS